MNKTSLIEARDEFIKLLPIIPIWLTILGSCNLYTKYVVYGINIFSYLDIQEILTLFLDDLFSYLIISNGLLFIISNSSDDDNIDVKINWSSKFRWLTIMLGIFNAILPILLFSYLALITAITNTLVKVILSTLASVLAINLALRTCKKLFIFIKERFENPVYIVYRYYIFSVILISAWAYGRALLNLSPEVSNSTNKYLGSTLITSSQLINIDKFNILIGRTKNYTFVFNTEDSCTSIIANSDIKSFYIKKKSLFK